jgi:hypothetical protein
LGEAEGGVISIVTNLNFVPLRNEIAELGKERKHAKLAGPGRFLMYIELFALTFVFLRLQGSHAWVTLCLSSLGLGQDASM